jgi:regulator of replication initiation timing
MVETLMELLEILEKRVGSLVANLKILRRENEELRRHVSAGRANLTQENKRLKRALQTEQALKDAMLKRVEGVLAIIQDGMSGKQ